MISQSCCSLSWCESARFSVLSPTCGKDPLISDDIYVLNVHDSSYTYRPLVVLLSYFRLLPLSHHILISLATHFCLPSLPGF